MFRETVYTQISSIVPEPWFVFRVRALTFVSGHVPTDRSGADPIASGEVSILYW